MMDLRTTLAAARRLRLGRGTVRLLSFLVLSTVGFTAIQGTAESLLEDEAERGGHVVFRHFL